MGTSNLFISYRREGGSGYAGRLFDAAAQHLGREHVFMDATSIAPGSNFVQSLRAALGQCQAMAVIVTPGWSEIADADGPRLQRADDWVRVEIETALAMKLRIVPTLVAGARMPAATALPPSLQAFSECQAVDLRDASWDDDVRRLVTALGLPGRSVRRYVVAGIAAVLALVAIAATLVDRPSPPSPSRAERSLDTLTPSDAQQAALVERYPGRGLNVLVLRHFLAGARQRAVPTARLQAELDRFAAGYGELQRANLYDDTGITGTDPGREPNPKCDETVKMMRDGDFAAAIAALQAGASSVLAKQPPQPNQRIYAAWCSWLRGQAEWLEDAAVPAAAAFDEAIEQGTLAGKDAGRLLYRVLRDSARLARLTGSPELAVRRFEQAIQAAGPVNVGVQTELMVELATFLDSMQQPAAALKWREQAQAIFDAARDPGDKQAQANAQRLAHDYETSNRREEAKALRERYGLPAAP